MKILSLLMTATFAGAGPIYAADLVGTAERSLEIQTFSNALKKNGSLTEVLKNKGPFTIFAPSDSAFNRMPSNEKDALLSDEKRIENLIASHIVPGKMLITEVKPGKRQTISGGAISLTSDNGLVKVENASVVQSDVIADNGVIHVIDTVVQPAK